METILGNTYTDSVSGCTGVAVAKTAYLFGDPKTCLTPPVSVTNDEPKYLWFDDAQLIDAAPAEA